MVYRQGPMHVANLRSTQGVAFGVLYRPESYWQEGLTLYWAGDLEFFVENLPETVRPSSNVTVVVVNNYMRDGEYVGQDVAEVALAYVDALSDSPVTFAGSFAGAMDSLEHLANDHVVVCKPQLALVIDGVWQVDPVQWGDQHNFNFDWKHAPDPETCPCDEDEPATC